MISAKEVNERAALAREKIETQKKAAELSARAEIDAEIAPILGKMLLDIERAIKKAMNAGAYGIEYPVEPLKGVTDVIVRRAYEQGLIKPLKEAGVNASLKLTRSTWADGLAIRWEGAS